MPDQQKRGVKDRMRADHQGIGLPLGIDSQSYALRAASAATMILPRPQWLSITNPRKCGYTE